MKILQLAAVCLVLAGCTTAYKAPVGESLPTLEVDVTYINAFDYYENGTDCSQTRLLPEEYSPYIKGTKPFPVKANAEIAFKPSYVIGLSICTGVYSFTSKPNHDYQLYNTLVKDKDGDKACRFNVVQKNRLQAPAKWEPVTSFKKRERVKGFLPESAHCEVLKK